SLVAKLFQSPVQVVFRIQVVLVTGNPELYIGGTRLPPGNSLFGRNSDPGHSTVAVVVLVDCAASGRDDLLADYFSVRNAQDSAEQRLAIAVRAKLLQRLGQLTEAQVIRSSERLCVLEGVVTGMSR